MGHSIRKIKNSPVDNAKPKNSETADNVDVQKLEIERIKRLLAEKIKDPNLAKKAAMIISEMINSKK